MQKVFITGGTGFFGKALLRYFEVKNLYKEYELTLFTRNKKKFLETDHAQQHYQKDGDQQSDTTTCIPRIIINTNELKY